MDKDSKGQRKLVWTRIAEDRESWYGQGQRRTEKVGMDKDSKGQRQLEWARTAKDRENWYGQGQQRTEKVAAHGQRAASCSGRTQPRIQ